MSIPAHSLLEARIRELRKNTNTQGPVMHIGAERTTGGNRILPANTTEAAFLQTVAQGLIELKAYADDTNTRFDLGAITVNTRRIGEYGRISVTVAADLTPRDKETRP